MPLRQSRRAVNYLSDRSACACYQEEAHDAPLYVGYREDQSFSSSVSRSRLGSCMSQDAALPLCLGDLWLRGSQGARYGSANCKAGFCPPGSALCAADSFEEGIGCENPSTPSQICGGLMTLRMAPVLAWLFLVILSGSVLRRIVFCPFSILSEMDPIVFGSMGCSHEIGSCAKDSNVKKE